MLLLLIVATIVLSVVLRENEWERFVSIVMVGVMLLFALRTSQASKRLQRVAIAVVPALLLATAAAAARGRDAEVIRVVISLVMTVLLLAVLLAIVRRLSTHLTISWNTILGALCVYLLFGLALSAAYSVAGHLQDNLLFVQQRGFNSTDTLYFSLITLTTVGFGDLTMRSDVTRIMSAMEALLGQIYLITAVGLLIGNLGRRRRSPRDLDRRVLDCATMAEPQVGRDHGFPVRLGHAAACRRDPRRARRPVRGPVVLGAPTPDLLFEYASTAAERGLQVVVAGAGGAATCPAWWRRRPHLPVFGVPVESHALKGIDSLLSIVQMPAGVPVGTLAIGRSGA